MNNLTSYFTTTNTQTKYDIARNNVNNYKVKRAMILDEKTKNLLKHIDENIIKLSTEGIETYRFDIRESIDYQCIDDELNEIIMEVEQYIKDNGFDYVRDASEFSINWH